jgi:alkylation response protein AidB-like acyl-CoA dehydrogenase
MCTLPIVKHGSEKLQERFLPKIADGEIKIAFGITEQEAGTNAFKISTRAEETNSTYIINGTKQWISGASIADYLLLVVRTTPYQEVQDDDKRKGGTIVIVPTDQSGISMSRHKVDITESIGEYSVEFNNVEVPIRNRIGEQDKGFRYIFDSLNPERITISAKVIGFGDFVLNRAVDYAKEREVFNSPIGSYQGLQHPMARAKIDLELADLANQRAIRAFEANQHEAGTWSNFASYASSEAADAAFDISLQAHGGSGFTRELDIITLQNNIRLYRIAPINNEMLLNYVGHNVLGLPKSY